MSEKETETAVEKIAKKVTIVHQRAIFALLEEHFDVEAGEYAVGWSDDKIAADVGVTQAAVSYRREGAFGKLKKTSTTKMTMAQLHDVVNIVASRLSDMEGRVMVLKDTISLLANEVAYPGDESISGVVQQLREDFDEMKQLLVPHD